MLSCPSIIQITQVQHMYSIYSKYKCWKNRECQFPTQRLYSISHPNTYGDRLRFNPAYPTSLTPTLTPCRRMCVGRKKCVTLLYNFLISIHTRRKQENDTNKTRTKHKRTTRDNSLYSAQKAAIRCQRSWWRPRSSSVVSQLHGRRSGGSHSTPSPTALSPGFTSAIQRRQTSGRPRGQRTPCLSLKFDWHATCCDALLL